MNAWQKSCRRLRHLFPVLFALAPVLALYSTNMGEVTAEQFFHPLLILLAFAFVLWLVLFTIVRNAGRVSLMVSAVLLLLFLFDACGNLFWWLHDAVVSLYVFIFSAMPAHDPTASGRSLFTIGFWLLVAVLLLLAVGRVRKDVTLIAWAAGMALTVPPILSIVSGARAYDLSYVQAATQMGWVADQDGGGVTTTRRDLYIVVLDAYARQDILKSRFGLDNEPFLRALESRGFVIARQSHANYAMTPLAVSSALNMAYVPRDTSAHNLNEMQPYVDHNRIDMLLKRYGYRFVSIPTGFDLTATPSADLMLKEDGLDSRPAIASIAEFDALLMQRTPMGMLLPHLSSDHREVNEFDVHRNRVRAAFELLGHAASQPYPKFVFTHILAPHPPFVFDAAGNPVYPAASAYFSLRDGSDYTESHTIYEKGYAAQLQFVNRRILESIDDVHRKNRRPYVLVLMGDHGARRDMDYNSLAKTDIHEAYSNLFAVYASPDPADASADAGIRARLATVITPINGLRAVMNAYFGTKFPSLADRSFYGTTDRPRDFVEVTDALAKPDDGKSFAGDGQPKQAPSGPHRLEGATFGYVTPASTR